MISFSERIAGARGCDIFANGTHGSLGLFAIIVREDDTVISSIKLSNGVGSDITTKNYIGKLLKAGELITFEKPLTSLTVTSGSVMGYFNK